MSKVEMDARQAGLLRRYQVCWDYCEYGAGYPTFRVYDWGETPNPTPDSEGRGASFSRSFCTLEAAEVLCRQKNDRSRRLLQDLLSA